MTHAKQTMEFFLDVDGVILDFETSFMDMIRENYLPELPKGYYPESWEMSELKGVDIEKAWETFVHSDRMQTLNLLCERDSFNFLADKFPVHLVSNIPREFIEKRKQNLHLHGLRYCELHLAGHENFGELNYPTKAQKISRIRAHGKRMIFLDDNPSNCKEIKEFFPDSEVYLMNRPHNINAKGDIWTRVANWNEFSIRFNVASLHQFA